LKLERKYHWQWYIENPPNTRMQHDRFAREIVAILALSYAARSRRLMRIPLAGGHHCCTTSYCPAKPPAVVA